LPLAPGGSRAHLHGQPPALWFSVVHNPARPQHLGLLQHVVPRMFVSGGAPGHLLEQPQCPVKNKSIGGVEPNRERPTTATAKPLAGSCHPCTSPLRT